MDDFESVLSGVKSKEFPYRERKKKETKWGVSQRYDDRVDSALFCIELWHNLFNFDR